MNDKEGAIGKSIKGVGMIVVLKLFLKVSQIFLNFAVIRAIDPETYGKDPYLTRSDYLLQLY